MAPWFLGGLFPLWILEKPIQKYSPLHTRDPAACCGLFFNKKYSAIKKEDNPPKPKWSSSVHHKASRQEMKCRPQSWRYFINLIDVQKIWHISVTWKKSVNYVMMT